MSFGVGGVGSGLPLPPVARPAQTEGASGEPFQKALGEAVTNLNKLQQEADSSATRLAAGEPIELHEVLLATEKASIAFQLAVQVRNKIVEAYQDVMRMQV